MKEALINWFVAFVGLFIITCPVDGGAGLSVIVGLLLSSGKSVVTDVPSFCTLPVGPPVRDSDSRSSSSS